MGETGAALGVLAGSGAALGASIEDRLDLEAATRAVPEATAASEVSASLALSKSHDKTRTPKIGIPSNHTSHIGNSPPPADPTSIAAGGSEVAATSATSSGPSSSYASPRKAKTASLASSL